MQSIAKNASALAVGGIIAQLAFVAIEVLVARSLGNEAYGAFASVYMLVLTITLVVDMGLTWYSVDRGSREPNQIAVLLGTTTTLKLTAFLVLYPLILLVGPRLDVDQIALSFLTVFFFYAVVLSLQDSLSAVNSARQSMHINAIFQGLGPLVVGALVLFTSTKSLSLNTIAICYIGGTGLVTVAWWIYTKKIENPSVNLRLAPGILKDSSWYGMTNVLAQLFYKSDILLLTFFSSLTQVGVYAAGYKILDVAYKIPILTVRVFSPPLFKLWKQNREGYAKVADVFMRFSLVSGGGLSIFCLFAANDAISLIFGDQFSEAALILQILSASFLLKFLSNCLQTMLSTMELHRRRTQCMALATVLLIVLQIVLIPRQGAIGAAISVVIADAFLCVVYAMAAGKCEIRDRIMTNAKYCGAIITTSLAVTYILRLNGAVAALFACTLFTCIVLASKFISISDINLLTKSTNLEHKQSQG